MPIHTARLTVMLLLIGGATHALWAGPAADKCQAGKNEEAGKYALCASKATAKLVLRGDAAAYSAAIGRCATKLADDWAKLEQKAADAGDGCPSSGDRGRVQGAIDAVTADVATQLSGVRYVDDGDGTVTDLQTGLMWEKKTGALASHVSCGDDAACPDPHDVNIVYDWSKTGSAASGTVFSNFIGRLNGAYDATCFNGHCDWRLPTQTELSTILLNQPFGCFRQLCIDTTVFGPTVSYEYWVTDTVSGIPTAGHFVSFWPDFGDFPGYRGKDVLLPARAVRSVR